MTPKMKMVADDLEKWIYQHYDEDYLENLFMGGLVIDDAIFQILVECCRYAYLVNADKHPWSYYIEQDGLESELARKNLKRTLQYTEEKFELEQKALKEGTGFDIKKPEHDLHVKRGRYPSYDITKFQYWELNNIHDMELVKAIVERRISSSNKISNTRFKSISEQYDSIVQDYKNKAMHSADDMVFCSLVLFTLQTKYSFDYYYKIACEMEKKGVRELPDLHDRIMVTSGTYVSSDALLKRFNPELFHESHLKIEYPMILQRERIIPGIVSIPEGFILDAVLGQLQEINILVNSVQGFVRFGEKLQDIRTWFSENTNIEDWASVFENYNVFRTFAPEKNWTDSKIKAVRGFYNAVSIDYKAIKSRS